MSALLRNLKIVWGNDRPKRYLPKSLNGGVGWGVWDDKEKRFLKDREVRTMSREELTQNVAN